jgi:hypothetical protein
MKKLIFILFAVLLIAGCNKKTADNNTTPVTYVGETKPQFDNTAFGVYKCIVVGSSGTIKLVINNGDNIVKAYLDMNDLKDTLTCSQQFTTGHAITNALFVGSRSSMTFSAGANGQDPSIVNIAIDGHTNVSGAIVHELSTQQVFCYEGTYSGGSSGTFNCIRFDVSIIGIGKDNSDPNTYQGNGTITDSTFSLSVGTTSYGATFEGTFDANGCSGTLADAGSGHTGTFSGTRTL